MISHRSVDSSANNLVYFSGGNVNQALHAGREDRSKMTGDGSSLSGHRDSMKGICTLRTRGIHTKLARHLAHLCSVCFHVGTCRLSLNLSPNLLRTYMVTGSFKFNKTTPTYLRQPCLFTLAYDPFKQLHKYDHKLHANHT